MGKIVNQKAVMYYLTYLIRQLTGKTTHIPLSIPEILRKWGKKRERGRELFYTPTTNLQRMWGDCDDFVTLTASKLKNDNKNFKIGFCIRKNGAYHVFILADNILIDPWVCRSPIKFKKSYYKNAENIVLYDIKLGEKWL